MSKFLFLIMGLVGACGVKAAGLAAAMSGTETDPQTGYAKMYYPEEAQQRIEAGGIVSVYVRIEDYNPEVHGGTFKSYDDVVYKWTFGEHVVGNGTILEMIMPAGVYFYGTLVGRLTSLHMYTFGEDGKPFYFDAAGAPLSSTSSEHQYFKLAGKRILPAEAPYDIIGAIQLGLAPEIA